MVGFGQQPLNSRQSVASSNHLDCEAKVGKYSACSANSPWANSCATREGFVGRGYVAAIATCGEKNHRDSHCDNETDTYTLSAPNQLSLFGGQRNSDLFQPLCAAGYAWDPPGGAVRNRK
ncbi:hypothetical protein [Nocardia nova]|uniref:hypothetical protein n=1 Tax=Nocardia nova TaxID=37330 RepID=UPI003411E533